MLSLFYVLVSHILRIEYSKVLCNASFAAEGQTFVTCFLLVLSEAKIATPALDVVAVSIDLESLILHFTRIVSIMSAFVPKLDVSAHSVD